MVNASWRRWHISRTHGRRRRSRSDEVWAMSRESCAGEARGESVSVITLRSSTVLVL